MSGSLSDVARNLKTELMRIGEILIRKSSNPLVEINSDNIIEIVAKNKAVVMLFTAEWCGRCVKIQELLLDIASKTFDSETVFGVVDVDRSYSIAERYAVQHIPTIVILVDGKVVDVIVGSTSKEKLLERIKNAIRG